MAEKEYRWARTVVEFVDFCVKPTHVFELRVVVNGLAVVVVDWNGLVVVVVDCF